MEMLPRGAQTTGAPPRCFDVIISSRSAISGPGNDGQRFAHRQSIIHIDIDIGVEEFGME